MKGVRRSGRIPREIPILLLGTDTSGRVFSEETHTLVLSRHGAGILSHNKFAPDELLTVRLPDSGREAEIRLVGNLGEGPTGGYVYGVAFRDPELDFWQMEFPPPLGLASSQGADLECSFCGSRSALEQSEVEADVFLVSQSIFRYCDSCGQTTPWKLAAGDAPAPQPQPKTLPAPPTDPPTPALVPAFVPLASELSAYSPGGGLDEVVVANFIPVPVAAPVAASVAVGQSPPKAKPAQPPAFSGGGKPNRRRHVRTRVQFTACVRIGSSEEIVECDNVSKGGLCFRSRKRYPENAAIQVAVPFSPGQPAIFVSAQIRRVEELSRDLFRYGVAYL